MAHETRIVAIGPEREMAGLASVGIEPVPVKSPGELAPALERQAGEEGVRVILLSESVAEGARGLVAELRRRTGTVILLAPAPRGSAGMAVAWLKHSMEQSIGVDMISGE